MKNAPQGRGADKQSSREATPIVAENRLLPARRVERVYRNFMESRL